ncbi:hypothetical protein DN069_14690 [Streptacidiphilus pinicola]|uniref:Uncharacterized protein n=1 Tax=Streptacidiphilus pinicola TaxID=2219663 RepID=A0A2X0K6J8_9ACTN|nr:hypothetical protein DN069_14690 [Streptacidiphilus pinicola]
MGCPEAFCRESDVRGLQYMVGFPEPEFQLSAPGIRLAEMPLRLCQDAWTPPFQLVRELGGKAQQFLGRCLDVRPCFCDVRSVPTALGARSTGGCLASSCELCPRMRH